MRLTLKAWRSPPFSPEPREPRAGEVSRQAANPWGALSGSSARTVKQPGKRGAWFRFLRGHVSYRRPLTKAEQLGLFGGSRQIKEPGKRGGRWYVDKHGGIRYGTPPTPEHTTFDTEKQAREHRNMVDRVAAERHEEREKHEGAYQRIAAAESDQGGEEWMAKRRAAKEAEGRETPGQSFNVGGKRIETTLVDPTKPKGPLARLRDRVAEEKAAGAEYRKPKKPRTFSEHLQATLDKHAGRQRKNLEAMNVAKQRRAEFRAQQRKDEETGSKPYPPMHTQGFRSPRETAQLLKEQREQAYGVMVPTFPGAPASRLHSKKHATPEEAIAAAKEIGKGAIAVHARGPKAGEPIRAEEQAQRWSQAAITDPKRAAAEPAPPAARSSTSTEAPKQEAPAKGSGKTPRELYQEYQAHKTDMHMSHMLGYKQDFKRRVRAAARLTDKNGPDAPYIDNLALKLELEHFDAEKGRGRYPLEWAPEKKAETSAPAGGNTSAEKPAESASKEGDRGLISGGEKFKMEYGGGGVQRPPATEAEHFTSTRTVPPIAPGNAEPGSDLGGTPAEREAAAARAAARRQAVNAAAGKPAEPAAGESARMPFIAPAPKPGYRIEVDRQGNARVNTKRRPLEGENVLGYTRSGKEVPRAGSAYKHREFPGWSIDDHRDAANIHREHARYLHRTGDFSGGMRHSSASGSHSYREQKLRDERRR